MTILARAQMLVAAAPGTGAVSLAAAGAGMRTWAAAGAANGGTYSYLIEEGTNWEIGTGTYSSTGPTLTRSSILASSNGGAAVNFGAAAVVSQIMLPSDIPAPGMTGSASLGGSTGYATFSTGLILQWGQTSGLSNSYLTFPIAFPNACRAVGGTVQYYDGANVFVFTVDAPGKSNVGCHTAYYGAGAGYQNFSGTIDWWALGF